MSILKRYGTNSPLSALLPTLGALSIKVVEVELKIVEVELKVVAFTETVVE